MINNEFYKDLGEKWHTSEGDAVALLRLENKTKSPWILEKLSRFHAPDAKVLDVGCGGGFLSLELAAAGYQVTALDVDERVLASGRAREAKNRIEWKIGTAEQLPFADQSFAAVCIMDVLEHVHRPKDAIQEAVRVLKPEGTLLFHTFNRTWLAWLFAAKGLDWFIPGSVDHIHDWRMFIKPRELEQWLNDLGFAVEEFRGIHPRARSVVKLLATRKVPADFEFALGGNLQVGYLGSARKKTAL